jgi:hypothetical protein
MLARRKTGIYREQRKPRQSDNGSGFPDRPRSSSPLAAPDVPAQFRKPSTPCPHRSWNSSSSVPPKSKAALFRASHSDAELRLPHVSWRSFSGPHTSILSSYWSYDLVHQFHPVQDRPIGTDSYPLFPIYCHVLSDYRRVLDWQLDLLDHTQLHNSVTVYYTLQLTTTESLLLLWRPRLPTAATNSYGIPCHYSLTDSLTNCLWLTEETSYIVSGPDPKENTSTLLCRTRPHRKRWPLPLLRVYPLLSNGYKQRYHCWLLTYSVHVTIYRSSDGQALCLPPACSLVCWTILRPWRWKRYVPPKRRVQLYGLHGVISQKMILFM